MNLDAFLVYFPSYRMPFSCFLYENMFYEKRLSLPTFIYLAFIYLENTKYLEEKK